MDFKPKHTTCPRCHTVYGCSVSECPKCNGQTSMTDEIAKHLRRMEKGKLGVSSKNFGKVKF